MRVEKDSRRRYVFGKRRKEYFGNSRNPVERGESKGRGRGEGKADKC